MKQDLVVVLGDGTYHLPATWRLDEKDSGRNGHRVIYRAAEGASPELSGGHVIGGWLLHDKQHGIWRAEIGNVETRQLYVNGSRVPRAAIAPGLPGKVTRVAGGFHTTSKAPQRWLSPGDLEFVWQGDSAGVYAWTETRCRVAAVSAATNGSTIKIVQPCFDQAVALYASNPLVIVRKLGAPIRVENSLSFLSEPGREGRWALQRTSNGNVIYYRPRAGQDPNAATIVVPTTQTLVRIAGDSAPVENLALQGLRFAHSTWLGPDRDEGFPNLFAVGYVGGKTPMEVVMNNQVANPSGMSYPPAAVELDNVSRIAIENSRFERLGGLGIRADGKIASMRVVGNAFRDISGSAIVLGRSADGLVSDTVIENNLIEAVGVEYGASPGILTLITNRSTIAHNHVANTGYTGIVLYGSQGWGNTHGNRVLNNLVEGPLWRTSDGGGIYAVFGQGDSRQNGLLLEGNLTRNARKVPGGKIAVGLYADMGSDWVTIRNNVTYGFTLSSFGCAIAPMAHVTWENNFLHAPVWYPPECKEDGSGFFKPGTDMIDRNNTVIAKPTPAAACAAISQCAAVVEKAGLEPNFRRLLQDEYGFDDILAFKGSEPIEKLPLSDSHSAIDFGEKQWMVSEQRRGYASVMHAQLISRGKSGTIQLRDGFALAALTLEGRGDFTIGDEVNPGVSGTLNGEGKTVTVQTRWTRPGKVVHIRFGDAAATVIDALRIAYVGQQQH